MKVIFLVLIVLVAYNEAITSKELWRKKNELGFKKMRDYAMYLYEELEKYKSEAETAGTPTDGAVTEVDEPVNPDPTEAAPTLNSLAQAFVNAHNVARAGEETADPALPTVSWDETLAAKCQVNVDQCTMSHDSSSHLRDGTAYSNVGQNLYMRSCSIKYTPEEYAERAVNAWMGEKKDWDVDAKICEKDWWYCGHYTQVVWRGSTKIGCAISTTCGRSTYVCCNYGPAGNWSGEKPY